MLKKFGDVVNANIIEYYTYYKEKQFGINLKNDIYGRYTYRDRNSAAPPLMSVANYIDPRPKPDLLELTTIEETLIARVHMFI